MIADREGYGVYSSESTQGNVQKILFFCTDKPKNCEKCTVVQFKKGDVVPVER